MTELRSHLTETRFHFPFHAPVKDRLSICYFIEIFFSNRVFHALHGFGRHFIKLIAEARHPFAHLRKVGFANQTVLFCKVKTLLGIFFAIGITLRLTVTAAGALAANFFDHFRFFSSHNARFLSKINAFFYIAFFGAIVFALFFRVTAAGAFAFLHQRHKLPRLGNLLRGHKATFFGKV